MIKRKTRLVVTFYTTAEAMATERVCKARNLAGRLISAPRNVTADCGIAWATDPELETPTLEALDREGVEYAGCYRLEL